MHSVLSHNEARGGPSQLISEWIPRSFQPSTLSQNIKYKYLAFVVPCCGTATSSALIRARDALSFPWGR